jgi:hypothetical protein
VDLEPRRSLRAIVLEATGQDVRQCRHCAACDGALGSDQDMGMETLLRLVQLDEEEVLASRTLWSDRVLEVSRSACIRGLDLPSVLLVLREEARKRGLAPSPQG